MARIEGQLSRVAAALITLAFSPAAIAERIPSIALIIDNQTQMIMRMEVTKGSQLAVDQIRGRGKKVNYRVYDSGPTASGTATKMREVIEARPDILITEGDSSKAAVAADSAETARLVSITPIATAPQVTAGKKFTFRACVSDAVVAHRLGKYATQGLKAKRVAIVYDAGQLYSVALRDEFRKAVEKDGAQIVLDLPLLSTSNSFVELTKRVVDSKPDVVMLPLFVETVKRFLFQAVAVPGFSRLELLGGDAWAGGEFFSAETSGVLNDSSGALRQVRATWVTHHDPSLKSTQSQRFVRHYTKRYGSPPTSTAAFLGYDAVNLAYETLAGMKGNVPEEIRKALATRAPFHGVSGEISYHGGVEPIKDLYILRHESGAIRPAGRLNP